MTDQNITLRNHPKYWLSDGSLIINASVYKYKVHRSLIERLSQQFFDKCCEPYVYVPFSVLQRCVYHIVCQGSHQEGESYPTTQLVAEKILEDEFQTLLRHLYHDMLVRSSYRHISPSDRFLTIAC